MSTGKEIERKFLTNFNVIPSFILNNCRVSFISQLYLPVGPDNEFRVRKTCPMIPYGSPYIDITVKSGEGLVRGETIFFINTNPSLLGELSKLLNIPCINKIRYEFNLPVSNSACLDIYSQVGVNVLEVEFDNVSQANSFVPPNWFGEDVTGNKKYKAKTLWSMLQN